MAPGREILPADLPGLAVTSVTGVPADATDWRTGLGEACSRALAMGEAGAYARLKREFEQTLLGSALAHTNGHRQRAAEILGLGRNTVTRKLGSSRRRQTRTRL
jgi:two-component system nitrogen regulation response regulator GlnG